MATLKRIGIITSGGDGGGLNAVIHGAAAVANGFGIAAYLIPNGYAGLYNLVDLASLTHLDAHRLDSIESLRAGSEAGHSRVKIGRVEDPGKYDRIRAGMAKFELDGLVISGGDDTGSVVVDLAEQGIPCVHAPKTMDLDLQTYSVGGDSAVNRIARFVQDAKTTGTTHRRIMITEVFGRYAGHTALRGGVAADADCILIPEIPADLGVVYAHAVERLFRRMKRSDNLAGTYTIVVAEGLRGEDGELLVDSSQGVDAFGHGKLAGAGRYVRDQLEKRLLEDAEIEGQMRHVGMYVAGIYERPEVRELVPGHLVRSGGSSAYDVNFGKQIGAAAVILLRRGITGVTAAGGETEIRYMPTAVAIRQRPVTEPMVALYEGMGVCFGRPPQSYDPVVAEIQTIPVRYL
jgi:6-phosphofructokinase 1